MLLSFLLSGLGVRGRGPTGTLVAEGAELRALLSEMSRDLGAGGRAGLGQASRTTYRLWLVALCIP